MEHRPSLRRDSGAAPCGFQGAGFDFLSELSFLELPCGKQASLSNRIDAKLGAPSSVFEGGAFSLTSSRVLGYRFTRSISTNPASSFA